MRSYRRLLRPGGRLAFSWFAGDDPRWDPVYEALRADIPEEERGPRGPGEEGPFSGPGPMDVFLRDAGYRPRTTVEPVVVRYPDAETWWSTLWSHGQRGTVEKLRDLGVLEATRRRLSGVLDPLCSPDGALEWVPQIGYTVADRSARASA